jgi:hypothetical protein
MHGTTFHVGDFILLRDKQGPARIGQIMGLYSGDPIWIKVQLLGRISDLVNLLPEDEIKDEVCLCLIPWSLDPCLSFFFC